MATTAAAPASDPRQTFFDALRASLAEGTLAKLVIAGPRRADADLLRVQARPIALKGRTALSFTYHHRTKDVTRNFDAEAGVAEAEALQANDFDNLHLIGPGGAELQLAISRKGKASLRRSRAAPTAPAAPATAAPAGVPAGAHDRAKHRHLDIAAPFLVELGVTDAEHRLIPAMARKWKQINKFVEVLSHALDASRLLDGRPADAPPVRVLDFGAGKGYLTFAVHDHLRQARGLANVDVRGVELREDLVALCNGAVERLGLQGLSFEHGDVRHHPPGAIDIMIALHACDTATDHAMHMGVRSGAAIILCSPCCHKQLRPQMTSPRLLLPMLQHGIHLGQQAEMLTDTLRAMLLEAEGYATQVFEFTSLEHTSKNKMILAVKRERTGTKAAAIRAQVREMKEYYGVKEQCLQTLLGGAEDAG